MFDKTNPSKEVIKFISKSIENSVSKDEIFAQVKSKYPELFVEECLKY